MSAAFLCLTIGGGCRQPESHSPRILAKVGDAQITFEDIRHHVDTAWGSTDAQLWSYVSTWTKNELLFQEAKRLGIDQTDECVRELEEVKHQLAGQLLLKRLLYSDNETPTDEILRTYYTNHTPEFFIREDMVKVNIALFNNRESAGTFAAHIAQGSPWKNALTEVQKDSTERKNFLSVTMGKFFTAHTLYPPELWKVVRALDINEVSFPVKIFSGSAILQLLGSFHQGDPAPYEIVRDEVRQRVLLEHRRHQYDTLLLTLRKRYPVQIMIDSLSITDSIRTHD